MDFYSYAVKWASLLDHLLYLPYGNYVMAKFHIDYLYPLVSNEPWVLGVHIQRCTSAFESDWLQKSRGEYAIWLLDQPWEGCLVCFFFSIVLFIQYVVSRNIIHQKISTIIMTIILRNSGQMIIGCPILNEK